MSNTNQTIVKQAVAYFKKGDYQQAKTCYQQAAQKFGSQLFANSIRLCDFRMGQPAANQRVALKGKSAGETQIGDEADTARQLDETQKLLEHYYTRCQELEYQLMDRQ